MPENKISISLNQKGNRNVNEWAEWLQVKETNKETDKGNTSLDRKGN